MNPEQVHEPESSVVASPTSHDDVTKAIEKEHETLLANKPLDESADGVTIKALIEELKLLADPEKKLEHAIVFMQQALSQSGVPHFKEFWEVRRICLDLFKENISPSVRMSLWTRYSELCRQARKLKEIFDEQSAFAVEQIEIAVSAIENEVNYLPDLLEKMPEVDFGIECRSLGDHTNRYKELQRELNLLNTYATKTNSLRKELIKTEMRIRSKNRFFERLSKLGDAVFPRRKELIQEVSKLFQQDVDHFIEKTFTDELKTQELFDAREEIKALQATAKVLTLNTECFSETRKRLSECWDSIKNVVKERKKEVSEQRAQYKKAKDEFSSELEALKTRVEAKEIADKEAEKLLDDISNRMRKTPLGKIEIRELRDVVRVVRDQIYQKMHAEETEKKKEAKKRELEAKEFFDSCRQTLQTLLSELKQGSVEECEARYQEALIQVAKAQCTRAQKQELETVIRKIKDGITDLKDQALLSDDERMELSSLEELLSERRERKQEIRQEIESLRRLRGSSGLDISQAMQYNELMESQKERLEKIEAGIREIEDKIDRLHT